MLVALTLLLSLAVPSLAGEAALDMAPASTAALRGVHFTGWTAGSTKARRRFLSEMKAAGFNAVAIALKDYDGKVFVKDIPLAGKTGAFVNAIPVFISSSDYWAKRFRDAKLPILGDDIKSQVGATILHRVLTTLFVDRGIRLDRTYQLNFGGNTDFLNMLERERLESKKISKTNAVTSMLPYQLEPGQVHVGPSDHVPWLTDRKWAYIRMEGTTFGDVPLNVEVKLEVWDSPNSAGVVIDAVRCAKIALDRGLSGPIVGPSSYFFKTPPKQFRDSVCREMTEAFIKGESNE